MFLNSLTSYIATGNHRQESVAADVVRLLEKYQLRDFLSKYL